MEDHVRSGASLQQLLPWIGLLVAGLLEVVWASAMKQSQGFTRLGPSIVTVAGLLVSFALLSWSMRTLPLGTAYTVWTGIGAVGAFMVGVIAFGEGAGTMRILAATMTVVGLALMKMADH